MDEKVFKLFADCIPVKGYRRSIIYDLGRCEYKFIPNSLYEILNKQEGISLKGVKNQYPGNDSSIDKYFDFLEANEYIFWCDREELKCFPDLEMSWDYPAEISNAVIQLSNNIKIDLEKIFYELTEIGCRHYVLHFFDSPDINKLNEISQLSQRFTIKNIDIYAPYSLDECWFDKLKEICDTNIVINNIVIYDYPNNIPAKIEGAIKGNISCIKESEINFNNISRKNFVVNISTFTEAQKHNIFFNRKVIISGEGYVKKSIHDETSDKIRVNNDGVKSIISSSDYRESWFVNKDIIDICRDCEFRYMCMDSRDPVKCGDGYYTVDLERSCPYNPYIAKWEGDNDWISSVEYKQGISDDNS